MAGARRGGMTFNYSYMTCVNSLQRQRHNGYSNGLEVFWACEVVFQAAENNRQNMKIMNKMRKKEKKFGKMKIIVEKNENNCWEK